ncbi:hypothetical protein BD560DRAFT_494114 [Blakeslea trispora]|nr:hypothetical protein BD560DRAFT_494114 [Blakeslea trispora]
MVSSSNSFSLLSLLLTTDQNCSIGLSSEDGGELFFCEFKATNGKSLAQYQQSKSCCLNATIAHKMLRLFVDEHVVFFLCGQVIMVSFAHVRSMKECLPSGSLSHL